MRERHGFMCGCFACCQERDYEQAQEERYAQMQAEHAAVMREQYRRDMSLALIEETDFDNLNTDALCKVAGIISAELHEQDSKGAT